MARSFQVDAALLAMSHSTIAESRRLLTKNWSERVGDGQDDRLTNSRASIADSKRLLASLEATAATHNGEARGESLTMPTTPATACANMDHDPTALSVHVFQEGARFGWTVCSPKEEIVGRGTAETELQARADAFCAGMIYLQWAKDQSPPSGTNLHSDFALH